MAVLETVALIGTGNVGAALGPIIAGGVGVAATAGAGGLERASGYRLRATARSGDARLLAEARSLKPVACSLEPATSRVL